MEKKHSKKLDKKRAKALRKQHKKLQELDQKHAKGSPDSSDDDIPFFMQDASIRSAMRAREFQAKEEKAEAKRAAKEAKKEAKKRKRESSSSGSNDSGSS